MDDSPTDSTANSRSVSLGADGATVLCERQVALSAAAAALQLGRARAQRAPNLAGAPRVPPRARARPALVVLLPAALRGGARHEVVQPEGRAPRRQSPARSDDGARAPTSAKKTKGGGRSGTRFAELTLFSKGDLSAEVSRLSVGLPTSTKKTKGRLTRNVPFLLVLYWKF